MTLSRRKQRGYRILRSALLPYAERMKEICPRCFQFLLQARGTIAVAAGPGLASVFVAALAAVMRILHSRELEVFFPVRTFFLQRRRAITHFDPSHRLVGAEPRFIHIAQIFAFGYGAFTERFALNGLKQIAFTTGFYTGSDQIAHEKKAVITEDDCRGQDSCLSRDTIR